MKILYCLAGTFNSGGMERIVISKANWLANHGYQVIIVTTDQNNRKPFFYIDNKIKTIDLNINYFENNNQPFIKKWLSRKEKLKSHKTKLFAILEKERPDISISTFGNEINFLHKSKFCGKSIVEIHFSRWFRLQVDCNILFKAGNILLTLRDKKYVKNYHKFVCLTHEDSTNWGKLSNLVVIPNFIDVKNFSKSKLNRHQVISVGRLQYQKGFDILIKAWGLISQEIGDWKLKIYGEGHLKPDLQQLIDSLHLSDSIEICKPVNNINDIFTASSILALSSHYEGLPMVLLEGMACGLPLVSFDCQCGPKDLIKNNVNGSLIKRGDIESLSNSILDLIFNYDKRKMMGNYNFDNRNLFDQEVIMHKWTDLFKEVITSQYEQIK